MLFGCLIKDSAASLPQTSTRNTGWIAAQSAGKSSAHSMLSSRTHSGSRSPKSQKSRAIVSITSEALGLEDKLPQGREAEKRKDT